MIGRATSIVPNLKVETPEQARLVATFVLSLLFVVLPWILPLPDWIGRALVAVGLTLGGVAALIFVQTRMRQGARAMASELLSGFIDKDASPSFVTDDEGLIHACNTAAMKRFEGTESETISGTLRSVLANPSAVLFRLQSRAKLEGSGREDIVTRRGHLRLSVHEMANGSFLWRVEDLGERPAGRTADTNPVPMISVGRTGAVLFMNEAARSLIGERVKSTERLFTSLPVIPGRLNTVMTKSGAVEVLVSEHERGQGRNELYFMKAAVEDSGPHTGFESLPVPLLKVRPCGEVLSVNRMAMRLLGIEQAEGVQLGQLMEGLG